MKKKILFIINTYDFMSNSLPKKISLKKKYKIFNKLDKSWANIFFNKLKKHYYLDKIYPIIDKKYLSEEEYSKRLDNKIQEFKPDLIIEFSNLLEIHSKLIKYTKIKKMIWISHKIGKEDLMYLKKIYNYLISGNNLLIKDTKKLKFKSFHMLISSPKILEINLNKFKKRSSKLFFAGSLGYNFKKRLNYLIFLSKNFKMKVRLRNLIEKYTFFNLMNSILMRIFPKITQYLYKKKFLPITNKLKYINDDEIFGMKLFNEIKNYKFCININSDFDQNNTINSRVFEALSCGCLLFTDKNKSMNKLFQDRKHVVYFSSTEDLKQKIKYYQRNLMSAYKIAKKGNYIFNKKYCTSVRFNEFKKILKNIKL